MKGTGFGSWECSIVVKVAKSDIAVVREKLEISTERHSDDEEYGYFVVAMTLARRGDDEAIIVQLGHMLGYELKWQVIWSESDY